MQSKLRVWTCFTLILILCCIDYAVFTEGPGARAMPDQVRKIAHFIILILITAVGYAGWKQHPVKWLTSLWVSFFVTGIFILLCIGFLHSRFHFSEAFMKTISDIRLFFCSPVPYFILYLLSVITRREQEMLKK